MMFEMIYFIVLFLHMWNIKVKQDLLDNWYIRLKICFLQQILEEIKYFIFQFPKCEVLFSAFCLIHIEEGMKLI